MLEIKDEETLNEAILTGYIIKFGAPWCQPCKNLDKVMEELHLEHGFEFASVNIDDLPDRSIALGVRTVPTVLAFKDSLIHSKRVGAGTKQDFLDWIETL